MKRIAIDARIINSSTGRYVERLITYLQEIDRENHYIIIVPNKDKDYWVPTADNFEVVTVDYKNYSFGEQVGFCKFLYSLKVDLVHFCMPQQPIFYSKPHVTTVHDLTLLNTYNSDKNWLSYHLKQFVGRLVFYVIGHTSRHILTPSRFTADSYEKFARISADKVTVTYEAADKLGDSPQAYPALVDKPFVMYVGQQSDYKNVRRLMQAHQELRAKNPELELVLVGSLNVAAERNKQWAQQQGFEGVRFTGFIPDNQLAWLYRNTRAYVFPSLMEGFGLPGLEAMVHGAPVISSNTTCLPEVYGDAAHYFDPTNIQEMAQAIEDVIGNEELRDELIEKGSKKAQEYSWQKMAEQTRRIYQSVLD